MAELTEERLAELEAYVARMRPVGNYRPPPGEIPVFHRTHEDYRDLVAEVRSLRQYLREKNDLLKAWAAATGVGTPEDAAEARQRAERVETAVGKAERSIRQQADLPNREGNVHLTAGHVAYWADSLRAALEEPSRG